jgi:hypothetical protein
MVVDSDTLRQFYSRADQLGLAAIREGVSSRLWCRGNLGLVIAADPRLYRGLSIVDDETISDKDFTSTLSMFLGKLTQKGIPGAGEDGLLYRRKGKWLSSQEDAWYNLFAARCSDSTSG